MGGMQLTEFVRQETKRSGSMYKVAQETGIAYSSIHGFVNGGVISSDTLDLLVRYLGLWDPQTRKWSNRKVQ